MEKALQGDYLPGHTFKDQDGQEWIRIKYIINGNNLAIKMGAEVPAQVYLVKEKT